MSSLGGSMGEGPGSGGGSGRRGSVDFSGYEEGVGNVETGTRYAPGTGFDEHGNLKTRFGKYDIGYDPVSGAATKGTTLGYGFPGEGFDAIAGGMQPGTSIHSSGLGDLFAPAPGHSTRVTGEEIGQRVQKATEQQHALGHPTGVNERDIAGRQSGGLRGPDTEGVERPSSGQGTGHQMEED